MCHTPASLYLQDLTLQLSETPNWYSKQGDPLRRDIPFNKTSRTRARVVAAPGRKSGPITGSPLANSIRRTPSVLQRKGERDLSPKWDLFVSRGTV